MRVSVFKRIGSYLLDAIPILVILSLLFSFLVEDIIKPEGYDALMEEYTEINEHYNTLIDPYLLQYENGDITEDEYSDILDNHMLYYNHDVEEHTIAMINYFRDTVFFYLVAFTLIYYLLNGFTKGKTPGRRLMKIELRGKINWWTLFVREVIWKTGYWMLTIFIGGIVLDIAMISFSSKKLAPRDIVTDITLQYEGVNYPF
jgi:hypothetical protein